MDPRIWGPHAWFLLHTISFSYPDHPNQYEKNNMHRFIEGFSNVIPCIICRNHFIQNLKNYPIEKHLHSRDALVNWMINIHNVVNKKLGKPIRDSKDIIHQYNDLYTKSYQCPLQKSGFDKIKNTLLIIFLILNIIVILYVICKKQKWVRNMLKKLRV